VAYLCMSFGWSWEFVEGRLDQDWLGDMNRSLRRHPPVHLLVRSLFQVEEGEDEPDAPEDDDARRSQFIEAFRGLGGTLH